MAIKNMTESEYITAWSLNAKQHFEDGDYEWLCDFISPYKTILEIGCGAGYSTLAFLLRGIRILAIDVNQAAIQATCDLLRKYDKGAEIVAETASFNASDALLWNVDVLNVIDSVKNVLSGLRVDLIVLCNPGGAMKSDITVREANLLFQHGFSKEEVNGHLQQGNGYFLHKYALIYAAADIARDTERPLLLVERGTKRELSDLFDVVAEDTGMRNFLRDFRAIKQPPDGGVTLGRVCNTDNEIINENEKMFWGAGIYVYD